MFLKSTFILVISIFILNYVYGQNQYVDRIDPYKQFVERTPVKSDFPPEIKTVIMEENFEGDETNYVRNFDENGRLYEYHSEPEGKADHVSYTCCYSEGLSSTGTFIMYESNGNVDWKIVHVKNEKGLPVSQVKKDGKGKLIEEVVWEYNDQGLLEHSALYESNKKKLVNEWFYYYDDEGIITKSELKDSKGRLEFTWIYDCFSEQNTANVDKETEKVCTWEEDTDEYFVVNEQRFNEKGEERHHMWRYTLEDKEILAYLIYSETNKLVLKEEYDSTYNKPLQIKEFKDGRVDNKGVYKYEEGLMTNYSKYDSKNELIEHHLYIYNDEGFMTRARIYDDRNKNEKTIVIKYKFEKEE